MLPQQTNHRSHTVLLIFFEINITLVHLHHIQATFRKKDTKTGGERCIIFSTCFLLGLWDNVQTNYQFS